MESSTLLDPPIQLHHFPFDDSDDDGMMRGRSNLQAHLDDLAQRHPELADQLRPWRGAETVSEPPTSEEQSGQAAPPLATKLSSTVPDMQQAEEELEARGVRSRSAPPASAQADQPQNHHQHQQQQPFVSRVDVNHQQVPPQQPQQQQPQSETQGRQPTVRHIPIFVEGRDEPLLPKEAVDSSSFPQQYRTQFHQHSQYQQPERPSSAGGHHRQEQQTRMPQQQPNRVPPQQQPPNRVPPSHQQQQPASSRTTSSQSLPSQSEPQQQQQSEEGQQEASPPTPPPIPPPLVLVLDPIARVGIIQKEVEALKEKVDEFQDGHSRQDKDYIYLDEMLTRNLLKLDDIETEGREDVRSARKEAIRSIQRCISILDSKTATPSQPSDEGESSAPSSEQPKS